MISTGMMIFITNVILIIMLGIMILLAARLSKSIAIFRTSRKELKDLMVELSQHIEAARAAVRDMHNTSDEAGQELQDQITRARTASDELKYIHDTAQKLADRLGDQIDKGRAQERQEGKKQPASKGKKSETTPPAFNIKDKEMDGDGAKNGAKRDEDLSRAGDEEEADMAGFQSRAERDLLAALKNKKKGGRAVK